VSWEFSFIELDQQEDKSETSLDSQSLSAYTDNMANNLSESTDKLEPLATPCLCAALRQASRAVTRLYDDELRDSGLRTTQHAVLGLLGRVGEVRKGDLGEMAALDETTLTRSLRPLEAKGWVTLRAGADRREKLVAITASGKKKLEQARPAWMRAQKRMQRVLPAGIRESLFMDLLTIAKAAANAQPGKKSSAYSPPQ
jgi:DNA-binding MarR family transcriptional regulator